MKRVLLLGGGHAHATVLRMLIRDPLHNARLTLVTPYDRHSYSGMLPGLVAGHYYSSRPDRRMFTALSTLHAATMAVPAGNNWPMFNSSKSFAATLKS